MRLDLPRLRERFGAVLFYGMQSVYELDSGVAEDQRGTAKNDALQRIEHERLHAALRDMVIVVPVREERLKLLDGVLAGIPNACQVIVVSNSTRHPIDRYQLEKDLVETFSAYTQRPIMVAHQKDPKLAQAFADAGYHDIIGDDGLIRNGKAEGMILATALAKLTGRRTIGFIDSDNYFPGAVLEYCHLYAAGFSMIKRDEHTFVRISWNSKPKVMDNSLYFAKWGRSSIVTNRFLNKLVSHYTGFETEVIRTGNAGEHALTIDLAMKMGHSSGYSIEPYQLIYLMEQFGGVLEPELRNGFARHVNVLQIESRNPHLHEYKGEEHVEKMIEASLSVIYHSPLCPDKIKQNIARELDKRDIRAADETLPKLRQYPPLKQMNLHAFWSAIRDENYGASLQEPERTSAPLPSAIQPVAEPKPEA